MSQLENNNMDNNLYGASAADFNKIPGSPIAYWISTKLIKTFENGVQLNKIAIPRQGLATMDNTRFTRVWHEVSISNFSIFTTKKSDVKWFPYNKGGDFRKWYGNQEILVNWGNNGEEIKKLAIERYGSASKRVVNEESYFLPSITWSKISSSKPSFRYQPPGAVFDVAGMSIFPKKDEFQILLPLLNSKLALRILEVLSPTLNFEAGQIGAIPVIAPKVNVESIFQRLITISKLDWNSSEVSWEFTRLPLLHSEYYLPILRDNYQNLYARWFEIVLEMQRLEEENNHIFIDAYGLQDELTPDVPLSEITLTCNPYYRYGGNLTDEEREQHLQSDTIAELISYTIGCMMGRYSLDREGLVYANADNKGFKTLVEEGAYARFPADSDGILPITTEAWFEDDIAARVEVFVHTAWGAEHLEKNLQFIADSLCLAAIKPVKKGGETSRETIRRYLSTQFFKDHLKTYKKRPIYWLFSSGKEKAFECLVYLHRYNETTLPRMRTEYVTPLLGQMDSRIERLRLQQNEAETAEAKRIGKEIDSLTKQLTELRSFDDQLKHYADMKIQLDLDDGVKVNYGKFGTLLAEVKAITGDKAE